MNMADKMKEKAIPATSVKLSNEVIKTISKADIKELNYSMRPIIEQNRREYIAGLEEIARKSSIYSSIDLEVKNKVKIKKIKTK